MAGGRMKPSSSFQTIKRLTLFPVAAFCAFILIALARRIPPPSLSEPPRASAAILLPAPKAPVEDKRSRLSGQAGLPVLQTRKPSIVIIIDDIGYDGQRLDRAMSIDPNLNFAVLPNSTRGADVAERLHNRGFEVLCHLPMEPRDGHISPGANAVTTSMSDSEIFNATKENIAAVPYARGVNNHMGSRATADRRVMRDVMRALPEGMYFIDSRTGGRSVAADVAREMNIKTATRQVFLDDVQTEAAVRKQLSILSATARTKGVAIGIGHPHDVTLRVLAREVPQLRAKGFRFVRASEVVN
jgi:uncharacterized protein